MLAVPSAAPFITEITMEKCVPITIVIILISNFGYLLNWAFPLLLSRNTYWKQACEESITRNFYHNILYPYYSICSNIVPIFSAKTHAHRLKVNSDFILPFEDKISSKTGGGTECTSSYLMLPVASRRKTTLAIPP